MDQFLLVYSEVSKCVHEESNIDLIFFNYSKALNVVCHDCSM